MYKHYINLFNKNEGCLLFNKQLNGGQSDNTNLFNNIETNIYKSNTGLTLLCIPNNDATIFSVGIYIRVGSLDENKDELGVAHFLEHMTFKGTGKYPGEKLIERLDDLGTSYNASTSYEYTNYYIHGLPQFKDELMTIILDMFFDPQIPEETVDLERTVIMEEYKMRNDSKSMKQYKNLLKLVTIEKNKLYGRPIIGTKKCINTIDINDLNKFRKKYNDHNKVLITVSGNINPSNIKLFIQNIIQKEWLDNTFIFYDYNSLERIDQKKFNTDLLLTTMKPKLSNRFIFEKIDGEQTNIGIHFPSWKSFTRKNIYLGIFSSILSDRLYKIVRIKNGLAYSINSELSVYDTYGLFSIYAGFDGKKIYKIIKLIFDELINLFKYGITEHELTKVKNSNLTQMMADLQNQFTYFGIYSGNVAYNYTFYTPNEFVDIYNNVDINRIKYEIIRHIINPEQLYMSVIGSIKPKNKKIIRLFNYFYKEIRSIQ